jgi:HD superfamily phosphohydrolase
MKTKTIKDSLHGYIKIPTSIFSKIIDTPIFQRLRRIEQTSMRPLYPCAHHDRFSHSIGVYYLGEKALESLISNIEETAYYSTETQKIWKEYGILFKMACLLHDCAHAPFSHSFESAYLGDKDSNKWNDAKTELKNTMPDTNDSKQRYACDIDKLFNNKPAPHEVFSAIIVAKYYSEAIKDIFSDIDPKSTLPTNHVEFIQRTILGMKYDIESFDKKEWDHYNILNCLIQLLNSKSFDVDKLDYTMRDSAAAGFNNLSVDVERILGALTIIEIHKFNSNTNVDADINNSITILSHPNGKTYTDNDAEQICALKLLLKDTVIDGTLDGSVKTDANDQISDIGLGLETKTVDRTKIIKGNGMIKGRLSDATMEGSFIGSIITSKSIEGFMKCHIKGTICGSIIGAIDSWNEKGITVYGIGYKQSALSIIDDTISARNRLYLWGYAHHKVTYMDYLLRYAVLNSFLERNSKEQFDYKNYVKAKELLEKALNLSIFQEGEENYLIDDGDFTTRIKRDLDKNNVFARKYINRTKEFSVWKNFADYNIFFYDLTTDEKKKMWQSLFVEDNDTLYESFKEIKEGTLQMFPDSILTKYKENYGFVWIKPSGYKVSKIESGDTYLVNSDKSVRTLKNVIEKDNTVAEYVDENYFYLYTETELSYTQKLDLIKFLKDKIRGFIL